MATVAGVTYQQQKRKCGKKDCSKCPHGPYWYAFWRDGIGRQHSKYVGKELPDPVRAANEKSYSTPVVTQDDQDWLTLGLLPGTSFTKARTTLRNIVVALGVQRKACTDWGEKSKLYQDIAAVRLAFKRLFPGRR